MRKLRTLPSLAFLVLVVVSLSYSSSEAGRSKTIEGVISNYECGDNCYLTIVDAKGNEHTGLCAAAPCDEWNSDSEMPAAYRGKKVKVTVGKGRQLNGEGEEMGAVDAFVTIQFEAPSPVAAGKSAQSEKAVPASEDSICSDLDLSVNSDILDCLGRKYARADKELNRLYKELMARLDEKGKSALKKEQLAWIKKKESECAKAGVEFAGGTHERICIADCLVQRTEERVRYLEGYGKTSETLQPQPVRHEQATRDRDKPAAP